MNMSKAQLATTAAVGVLAGTIALFSPVAQGQGLISNPSQALNAFCEYDTTRQTIIYVDQSMVSLKDENWFRDILNRIDYVPAERINVRLINESNSRVDEVWSSCHPSLSQADYEREQSRSSMFRRGIDRNIQDAQQAYRQGLSRSLAVALQDIDRQQTPHYDSEFPNKSLVEALFYDVNAFRLEGKPTRVVMFSNLVENSNLATPEALMQNDAEDIARRVSARFNTNFNNAEFHVYGIGYTHSNAELDNALNAFWSTWLNRSGAHLASFSRQLSLPNDGTDLSFRSYRGTMSQADGTYVAVRLRLGVTEQGALTNSWFGIRDIRYPVSGQLNCQEDSCTVRASIDYADDSYEMFREEDMISLSGTLEQFSGEIGGVDTSVRTQDGSRFSIPLEFVVDDRLLF